MKYYTSKSEDGILPNKFGLADSKKLPRKNTEDF